jgi:hypothetical protein
MYWTKTPCQDDDDQERAETGSERKQALPHQRGHGRSRPASRRARCMDQ